MVLIEGCAGSGKSEALIEKVLSQKGKILLLTASELSSRELKERFTRLKKRVDVFTMRGFCAKVLANHISLVGEGAFFPFSFLTTEEKVMVVSEILTLDLAEAEHAVAVIQKKKKNLTPLTDPSLKVYHNYLREKNLLDYDDLLYLTRLAFLESGVERWLKEGWDSFWCEDYHLLEEEEKDLVKKLFSVLEGGATSLFVPKLNSDLEFREKVTPSETSNRTNTILFAMGVVLPKKEMRGGEPIRVVSAPNSEAEGNYVASTLKALEGIGDETKEDMAILYSHPSLLPTIEEGLKKEKVLYQSLFRPSSKEKSYNLLGTLLQLSRQKPLDCGPFRNSLLDDDVMGHIDIEPVTELVLRVLDHLKIPKKDRYREEILHLADRFGRNFHGFVRELFSPRTEGFFYRGGGVPILPLSQAGFIRAKTLFVVGIDNELIKDWTTFYRMMGSAQKRLFLTFSRKRVIGERILSGIPTEFLKDLPEDELDYIKEGIRRPLEKDQMILF